MTLNLLLGTTLKVFFEDVDDETPTSVEINLLIQVTCGIGPL